MNPATGQIVTYPTWTEYIWLRYGTRMGSDRRETVWDYDRVIDHHPEIANDWTKESLRRMEDFLHGKVVILGGLLRVLPIPADIIRVNRTVSATQQTLQEAEDHIQAGRLPILKDTTKQSLLEKARQHEISQYGRPLRPDPQHDSRQGVGQPSLFNAVDPSGQ